MASKNESASAPLSGVRVVNIGTGWAGRVASMLLADQGADVIEFVRPGRAVHPCDPLLDRGKRLLEIDLKDSAENNKARELVAGSDVVFENMRAGAAAGLQLDYASLSDNERIVYVSLPGFAEGDEHHELPAWEGIVNAAVGIYTDVSPLGPLLGGDPIYSAIPMASAYAGVLGAVSASMGLYHRECSGQGQRVVVPLADAIMSAVGLLITKIEGLPERYNIPQIDNPWFLWFAFNLPHVPFHLPPEHTWQSDYSHIDPESVPPQVTGDVAEAYPYFSAMIEAMDTQIGRLLASLDPEVRDNTYVIFIGDNGSPKVSAPFRSGHGKGTVYEGGIHVPMIVTGPGITGGGVSEALVNSADLFATIMEMAEIDPEDAIPEEVTHDSISFFPILSDPDAPTGREWLYADYFAGGVPGAADGDYAMRGDRYKLLRHRGTVEFYDLERDPYEHDNLLSRELSVEEDAAYRSLGEQIRELRSSE
jgi:hypothetical protein